jgi:hypothetical protein
MLEGRLKRPRCGSRRVVLLFDLPANPMLKRANRLNQIPTGALPYALVEGVLQMTDFDADNLMRPGYRNSDPIAQAWITGVIGGLVVAVVISGVAYSEYHTVPQLPLTTSPTGIFETQPVLPVMLAPPAESLKP